MRSRRRAPARDRRSRHDAASNAVELFVDRHRPRHRRDESLAHLRSVLHDARRRRGHRPRPEHLLRHRPRSRRPDRRREPRRGRGRRSRSLLPACLDELQRASCEVLVAHPEQNERDFITAALRGWGYQPLPAATLQEALELHRAAGAAAGDRRSRDAGRSISTRGATRRVVDDRRRLPMILTSMAPDDPAIEQFGRSAAASLTAPLDARGAQRGGTRNGGQGVRMTGDRSQSWSSSTTSRAFSTWWAGSRRGPGSRSIACAGGREAIAQCRRRTPIS